MLGPKQQAWVDTLRSGEYKQGRLSLCTIDNDGNKFYCCLGVGCEMFGYPQKEILDFGMKIVEFNEESKVSVKLKEELKLRSNNGQPKFNTEEDVSKYHLYLDSIRSISLTDDDPCCLAQLNDQGFTFNEIADIIEKYSDNLFEEQV